MKKNLTKVILATILAASPMLGDNSGFTYNTKSLFAIEGSYNNVDVENLGSGGSNIQEKFAGAGLKIGAQGEHYRIFVSGRAYDIENFSYAYTYGGEIQYLFNFSKLANFYVGANAGMAIMKRITDTDTVSVDDPYYGGDIGFNIHVTEMVDLELGVRGMQVNNFDNIAAGYASIIFKYDMD